MDYERLLSKPYSFNGVDEHTDAYMCGSETANAVLEPSELGLQRVELLNELLLVMVEKAFLQPSALVLDKLDDGQHDGVIFHDIIVSNVAQKSTSMQFLALQRLNVLWNALLTLLSQHRPLIGTQAAEMLISSMLEGGDGVLENFSAFLEQLPVHIRTTFALLFLIFDLLMHVKLKPCAQIYIELLAPLLVSYPLTLSQAAGFNVSLHVVAHLVVASGACPTQRNLKLSFALRAAVAPSMVQSVLEQYLQFPNFGASILESFGCTMYRDTQVEKSLQSGQTRRIEKPKIRPSAVPIPVYHTSAPNL